MNTTPKTLILAILICISTGNRMHGQSKAFEMFAPYSDLNVSFIGGYRINDTTKIDATLIYTKDTAAWERLLNQLNLHCNEGENPRICIQFILPDDPTQRTRYDGNQCDFLVCHPHDMSLCIFHNPKKEIIVQILDEQFHDSIYKSQKK